MPETQSSYHKNDWHLGKGDLAQAEPRKDIVLGRKRRCFQGMTSLAPSLRNVKRNLAPGSYWVCNSPRTTTEEELSEPILPMSR